MIISYTQKQQILEFLADPSNWDNRFDLGFFMDQKRKWKRISQNGVELSQNQSGTEAFALHKATGAAVQFKKTKHDITIRDESGRVLTVQSASISVDEDFDLSISPMQSSAEIGLDDPSTNVAIIEYMGAYISFALSGEKTVFLDDIGQKVNYPKPTSPIKEAFHLGQFFHVISFNLASADKWGMSPRSLLDGAKLVVSKDLGLEPNLRTINEIDPDQARAYIEYLLTEEYDDSFEGPIQWRPIKPKKLKDLSVFAKAWDDTTQFSGYFIDTPRRFFVQKAEDGFDLATSLDHRERIWSHGQVFKSAASAHTTPIQMITTKTPPHTLLHMLERGNTTRDHRGREWTYIIFETKDAAKITELTRGMIRDNFHLSGDYVSTINFDDGLCILAIDCDALTQTKLALDATRQMLSLIQNNGTDVKAALELLAQGADLKYVDPESARAGRTFANTMRDAGNDTLLQALQGQQGTSTLEDAPVI